MAKKWFLPQEAFQVENFWQNILVNLSTKGRLWIVLIRCPRSLDPIFFFSEADLKITGKEILV